MNQFSASLTRALGIRFFVGAIVGYAYQLLLILSDPHLLHFIPSVSLLRTLSYATVIGVLFTVCELLDRLVNFRLTWLLPPALLTGHSLLWLLTTSRWSTSNPYGLIVFGTVAGTTFVGSLVAMMSFHNYRSYLIYLLLIPCLLTSFQYGILNYLPANYPLNNFTLNMKQLSEAPPPQKNSPFFPFSFSVKDALRSYPGLMPDIPEGRKIFVLVLDAVREDFVGDRLNGIQVTPNLSKLGRKHLDFENYLVQAPWTKASTASLFTGRYVRQHATFLGGNRKKLEKVLAQENRETKNKLDSRFYGHALPKREVTLAERLKKKNFSSAGFASVEHINQRYQFDQGFDYYDRVVDDFALGGHRILNHTLFWLLKKQPDRSFVYMHLKGPHVPYTMARDNIDFWRKTPYLTQQGIKPPKWDLPNSDINELAQRSLPKDFPHDIQDEKQFIRHLYAAELNAYDKAVVPQITGSLKTLDLWQETLFVATSDHGEGIYDHGKYFGHGQQLYQEAINPFLVMKPMQDQPIVPKRRQRRIEIPLESIDLTASLLNFAEASRNGIEGSSALPFLTSADATFPDTAAFAEKTGINRVRQVAVQQGPWKYIHNTGADTGNLFNLRRDPDETRSLEGHTNVRRTLKRSVQKGWGKNGSIKNNPVRVNITDQEMEALKGLGYLK